MSDKCPVLTTADGAPIGEQQALTAGPRGPLLMQDVQLLEQMQHFNRERIPERVVRRAVRWQAELLAEQHRRRT